MIRTRVVVPVNNCFQTEASVAAKDFKPKDLELKTSNILTCIHLTLAHQQEPILS